LEVEQLKQRAAEKAMDYVKPGQNLGLGTGSTAAKFVDLLGAEVKAGLEVLCVPTSETTHAQAAALGIPLTTLDETPFLDLTIDGADEIDNELRLIKGGGGALLREKIVATASERMVVIADFSKKSETLGGFPLPVEVVKFGLKTTQAMIDMLAHEAGCSGNINLRLNGDGTPFQTDGGNHIFDCSFHTIQDPEMLAEALQLIPGVVDTGLFLGIADVVIIANPDGITVLQAPEDENE